MGDQNYYEAAINGIEKSIEKARYEKNQYICNALVTSLTDYSDEQCLTFEENAISGGGDKITVWEEEFDLTCLPKEDRYFLEYIILKMLHLLFNDWIVEKKNSALRQLQVALGFLNTGNGESAPTLNNVNVIPPHIEECGNGKVFIILEELPLKDSHEEKLRLQKEGFYKRFKEYFNDNITLKNEGYQLIKFFNFNEEEKKVTYGPFIKQGGDWKLFNWKWKSPSTLRVYKANTSINDRQWLDIFLKDMYLTDRVSNTTFLPIKKLNILCKELDCKRSFDLKKIKNTPLTWIAIDTLFKDIIQKIRG